MPLTIYKDICTLIVSLMACAWASLAISATSPYDVSAENAASYLESTQYPADGSWGNTDNIIPLYTAEAVQALYALNRRTPHYYAGITWLENHRSLNVEYSARRVLALSPTQNNLSSDFNYLVQSQNLSNPGNNGWGISPSYQGSVIDTSLTLQALLSVSTIANTAMATSYLQSAQLTGSDKGWPAAQEGVTDASATAQAIIALVPRLGASNISIVNAVNTLKTKVNINSPVSVQALAARAYLTVNPNSADAATLLNNLKAIQSEDGSIGNDAYTTALAIRAFALSAGKDLAAQRDTVNVPDQNLRNAINQALGKSALDNLNKGELTNLLALDISGRNVKSLVGLEWAVNLMSLNASNNQITSTAPISGLTNLTDLVLTNNPINTPPTTTVDAPTLPEWGMILLGLLLLYQFNTRQRRLR